jgi:hypothetical protein
MSSRRQRPIWLARGAARGEPVTSRYIRAARRLLDAIGEQAALAGGLAVNAHGFARATRDVDVVTSIPLAEARARLSRIGIDATLHKGDPLEGDFPCLRGVIGVGARTAKGTPGVPFDVLPELVPITAAVISVQGESLRIVDADTLIRLKLKAGSVKDLYDVAILTCLQPALRGRAEALAAADPSVHQRLADMLDDPRTKAQANEIRRQDRAVDRFARRRPTSR